MGEDRGGGEKLDDGRKEPTLALQLYNTLTRAKERFEPVDPSHVRMYVCGPTVYDFAHIGNARPVVVFDVLYRLLKRLYPRVTYVRNITDVDDKIIARARETGEDIAAITARYVGQYHADMAALGALPPDVEPRATAHIAQMIAMIEKLIASAHAYTADGHVLFSVPSMADYGRLSRHSRDELIAGARVEVAPYKQDPADFVLWKPSSADQPGWDSPWGRGRPGWHLECSAMSETHLGQTFDIHGGGLDLIFPHHENEIAQSVCAHGGAPFVRYWMHNGYVTVEGEKMSKSLGNFYTVRRLLDEGWNGETIRLALLSAHYRAPLDFSRQGLEEAKTQLDRLYGALRGSRDVELPKSHPFLIPAQEALEDDLNTPRAIAELHQAASNLNSTTDPVERSVAKSHLLGGGELLGLLTRDAEAWFKGFTDSEVRGPGEGLRQAVQEAFVTQLIEQRRTARKQRNFAEADRIRGELLEKGIILEDRPDGTTDWRRA
jgi:cysteinyl-tRNA synthetase